MYLDFKFEGLMPGRMWNEKHYRYVSVPPAAWEALKVLAKRRGMNRTRLCRVVLLNWIQKQETLDVFPEVEKKYERLVRDPNPDPRRAEAKAQLAIQAAEAEEAARLKESEAAVMERYLLTGHLLGKGAEEVPL